MLKLRFLNVLFAIVLACIATSTVPASAEVPQLDGRIVGGQVVSITSHPHQVSVRYKSCSACTFSHLCGGSIYDEQHIITAAHCVGARNQSNFVIVAGSDNRNGADGVISIVDSIVVHEKYDAPTYNYDIAVLKLSVPLPINYYSIAPIELTNIEPAVGQSAVVTGWGNTEEGGLSSVKLQAVTVPIISHERCTELYYDALISDNMLCAADQGKDACQGDSGGPLVVNNRLAGVVSWGYGCARPESPGVYANVFVLKQWIEDTINGVTTPTQSTPTDSTPTGSTPTDSTPTGSTPTDSTPTGSTPTDSTPTGSTPTDSTPTGSTPTDTTPTGSTPTPSPTPKPEYKFEFY